ncbi:MAG: class I SAM-dependent methyltransferase [Vicinamibacterales bacterium]
MRALLKHGLLSAVGFVTRRSAVLLASDASREAEILSLNAPYRVAGERLTIQLLEPSPGELQVMLRPESGNVPTTCRFPYDTPGPLTIELRDGSVSFAGRVAGTVSGGHRIIARRFSLDFEMTDRAGRRRRRATSHYIPREGHDVDRAYFSGEDYVDYEAESAGVPREVIELARRHGVHGPVLEIGCATGGTLAALGEAGFEAYGLDGSAWAVSQARTRVGDLVWECDVERHPLPAALSARAPFGCLVLASVLEHFEHPMAVLTKLTAAAAPEAALIVLTTNGDSLTRRVFGRDWEGYFDWTHKGVDAVTPQSLRYWLAELGWSIRELRTWHLWDSSGDPTHATLRDWHAADARFRALLAERELGDFIACVAVRT